MFGVLFSFWLLCEFEMQEEVKIETKCDFFQERWIRGDLRSLCFHCHMLLDIDAYLEI